MLCTIIWFCSLLKLIHSIPWNVNLTFTHLHTQTDCHQVRKSCLRLPTKSLWFKWKSVSFNLYVQSPVIDSMCCSIEHKQHVFNKFVLIPIRSFVNQLRDTTSSILPVNVSENTTNVAITKTANCGRNSSELVENSRKMIINQPLLMNIAWWFLRDNDQISSTRKSNINYIFRVHYVN